MTDKNVINGIKLNSKLFIYLLSTFTFFIHSNIIFLVDEPDADKVISVIASCPRSEETESIEYTGYKVIGNGSFGVVFQARLTKPVAKSVAIKKVLQDKRFKNRELQIMRLVDHVNIVALNFFFYSNGEKKDEVFLNLVLDYVPETIYRASRYYAKLKQSVPIFNIKLYMFQVFRSLAYIHALGICHRDIKPQNLVIDRIVIDLVIGSKHRCSQAL